MSQIYPLIGVALGPGDPEMITLKGLKALQNADVVYYPASKIEGDKVTSFSKPILDHYKLEMPCKPICFPMTLKDRDKIYNDAYAVLKQDIENGLKVVLVNEGDLLFYSTFGYLLELAKKDNKVVEAISGIPAFIASGGAALQPIVEGDSSFTVIARPHSFDQVKTEVLKQRSVVVMKMKVLKEWYFFLKYNKIDFTYIEKVGTDEQYITRNVEDLKDRVIPYFALIMLNNQN